MSGKSSAKQYTRKRAKRVDPTQPKEILKRTMKNRVEKVFPKSARLAQIAAQRAENERRRANEEEAAFLAELFRTKKKKKKVKPTPVKENEWKIEIILAQPKS